MHPKTQSPCFDVIPLLSVIPPTSFSGKILASLFVMASINEVVAGLVYDYLLKKDTSLAQTFKKKTKAVCIYTRNYFMCILLV